MAHLIDKDAVIAEIEKLKDDAHRGVSYHQSRQEIGLNNELSTWEHLESAFATILKVINTLEVKEVQEPASEDLEQAANDFAGINYDCESESDAFYHYIQTDAFIAGAEWQKEQMMKDAIDSEVKWCNHGYPDIHMEDLAVLDEIQLPKNKFAIGDKVKIIIMKDQDG